MNGFPGGFPPNYQGHPYSQDPVASLTQALGIQNPTPQPQQRPLTIPSNVSLERAWSDLLAEIRHEEDGYRGRPGTNRLMSQIGERIVSNEGKALFACVVEMRCALAPPGDARDAMLRAAGAVAGAFARGPLPR